MLRLQAYALTFLIVLVLGLATIATTSSQHAHGYETHCEHQNANDENCATDNVTLVFLWKIGKAFDTHNGAVAAAAGILVAIFTFTLWQVTGKLWRSAENQLAAFRQSIVHAEATAKAAMRQTEIAERSLTLAQRPWITVEVKTVGPMVYGANGADFIFEYTMENVGNSPALRAFPHPILYSKTKPMPSEATILQDYICSRRDPTEDTLGFIIGPKSKYVFTIRQAISYEDILNTTNSYKINGIATGILPLKLIGIVAYRSAFSEKKHETSFYYNVMKTSKDNPAVFVGISTYDQGIDAEDLVLMKNILFSPYMT